MSEVTFVIAIPEGAKQSYRKKGRDCHVASLLAMTFNPGTLGQALFFKGGKI